MGPARGYLRPLLELSDDVPPMSVLQFPNGSANLTYLSASAIAASCCVARRSGSSHLARTTCAREYRVLSRLWQ